MLIARAYSLRQKSRLAISLSWVAGYTNLVTLYALGLMTSHVTGNVTHLAQNVSEFVDPWDNGRGPSLMTLGFLAFIVVCFFLGAVLSGAMLEIAHHLKLRSQYISAMGAQAILLGVLSIGVSVHFGSAMSDVAIWWMTAAGSLAMGLQNATITRISGAVVRTTHLTGVVTDLGLETVHFVSWYLRKLRRGGHQRARRLLRAAMRDPVTHRILLLVSILGSFVIGVVVGTIVMDHTPRVALVPPVLFLLAIILIDWFQPIAELKEVDLMGDPELRAHGIERSMLPDGLAIHRVWPRLPGRSHSAPGFASWSQALPKRQRVVILALTPHTEMDSNAVLDLVQASESIRGRDGRLILANVSPGQYRAMLEHGLFRSIDSEDACPDLEFAVARGLELCRHLSHDR